MTIDGAVAAVVTHLEKFDADYLIVGAIAYFLYGIPRATNDADFVVRMQTGALDKVLGTLPPGFAVDPQSRMELFTGTTRWVADIPGTVLKVEFFLLGEDPHHQEEFRRRRRHRLAGAGIEAWVATAEDLIVQKLRWARLKDLADVESILMLQHTSLDHGFIEQWCTQHSTLETLRRIQAGLPPAFQTQQAEMLPSRKSPGS